MDITTNTYMYCIGMYLYYGIKYLYNHTWIWDRHSNADLHTNPTPPSPSHRGKI